MSPYIIQDTFVEKSFRLILLETSIIKSGIHKINHINFTYVDRCISTTVLSTDLPLIHAYYSEVAARCGLGGNTFISINSDEHVIDHLLNLYKFDSSTKAATSKYHVRLHVPCNWDLARSILIYDMAAGPADDFYQRELARWGLWQISGEEYL